MFGVARTSVLIVDRIHQAEDVVEGVDELMKELDELGVEGLAPGEAEVRALWVGSVHGSRRVGAVTDGAPLPPLHQSSVQTWPAMTDPMRRVLQTEQEANLETVARTVDLARAATLLVSPGKEKQQSLLAPALLEAFAARGAPAPKLVGRCDCCRVNKHMFIHLYSRVHLPSWVGAGHHEHSDSVSTAELEAASVLVLLPEAKDGPKLPFGGGGGALDHIMHGGRRASFHPPFLPSFPLPNQSISQSPNQTNPSESFQ